MPEAVFLEETFGRSAKGRISPQVNPMGQKRESTIGGVKGLGGTDQ